jgi:hypothetical protein
MVTQVAAKADVRANLAAVNAEIAAAATAAHRSPADIALVAISKSHPVERILPAIAAGHRLFGENRVQEAETKWPPLKAQNPGLRLHLVGPLQRNKTRRAIALFDAIESVDDAKLARSIAEAAHHAGRCPDLLVQVNTGEEPQKHGVYPGETEALIRCCRDELQLPLVGLMCIPPIDEEPALHFALLREIARRNGLRQLSMGMSADFPIAIRFGATLIRVGTAIFGPRSPWSL